MALDMFLDLAAMLRFQAQRMTLVRRIMRAKIFKFFKSKGFSDEQAAGWVGNLRHESGLDPAKYQEGTVQVSPLGPAVRLFGPGRGLAQWEKGGGRFEELVRFAAYSRKALGGSSSSIRLYLERTTNNRKGGL
jgi:hypothetical protein